MKIGIDTRPLQHETQYRGIGKSLESLIIALEGVTGPKDSLTFYIDNGLPKPKLLDEFPDSRVIAIATARLGRKRYIRSVLPSFKPINPSAKDIDVLLQYDASFGVSKKVPTVVVFHDLIPYLFRGQEKQRPVKGARKLKDALARSMYWNKYLRTLKWYKNAKKIIAISESSKKDLLAYMPSFSPSDIAVIHHGPDRPLAKDAKLTKRIQDLASGQYLLYVGGIDIRKNIYGLLETFYRLKPNYPLLKLILVGKEFELKDRLEDLGWYGLLNSQPSYAKDVITTGFVSAADLSSLYSHATAFVLPSRYEGFGMPVLEAMSAGSPVVAYDNSSIPEVAGKAAILVRDGADMAPAISKILNDPQLRAKLIKQGKKQAAEFSWTKSARQTLQALKQAAN